MMKLNIKKLLNTVQCIPVVNISKMCTDGLLF